MKQFFIKLQNFADKITAIGTIMGLILGVISIIFSNYQWTPENTIMKVIRFFGSHLIEIWALTATLLLLYVWLQYKNPETVKFSVYG